MSRLCRPALAALALLCAVAIAGCGASEKTHHAADEGTYLDLGSLRYQVQLSRQLNPRDAEDRSYLMGLTPKQASLRANQAWFSVWLRVENPSGQTRFPALAYKVTDTQGQSFEPVFPAPINVYAYRPLPIPGHGQLPAPDTVAEQGSIQGSMLLFKLPVTSYDNRPLVLEITDQAANQTATVDLDV